VATTVPTTVATTVPTTVATTVPTTVTTTENGDVGGVSAFGGTLPATGTDLWPLGVLGGALLTIGMALVLVPSRRSDDVLT
ncbi:MAG TPA: LPXTG cell wall anchor domain-containing protein, partial [Acidimicrobiales bacterium]